MRMKEKVSRALLEMPMKETVLLLKNFVFFKISDENEHNAIFISQIIHAIWLVFSYDKTDAY